MMSDTASTSPSVGVVCDSTCDLGNQWLAENGVLMVPLKVLFGDTTYLDWVDLQPDAFYERLTTSPALPKTSQPSPAEFLEAYRSLAAAGVEEVVSIHLTAALSGTCESARLAAEESPIPVRVVNTMNVTHAVGLVVRAAVEARDSGADAAAVEARALQVAAASRLYFVPETLEYLVKGGRAGKAQGLAASLLNIKPVLCINEEGIVAPYKKVRGLKSAFDAMAARVAADSQEKGALKVAVFHACAPELADQLHSALEAQSVEYESVPDGLVGSVIGTYAGPRAVGLAYHPVDL